MKGLITALSDALGSGLATFLGAMLPLIELKGSIMFARGAGLGFFKAFFISYLGSTAVFFILFFLLKPFLNLLKRVKFFKNIAVGIENYISDKAKRELEKRSKNINTGDDNSKKREEFIKTLAVCIFVAIPLPMTGVWTGTAIAAFINLDFFKAFFAVAAGNLVAGLIISVLAELFLPYVDIILYSLFVIAAVMFVVFVVKIIKNGKSKNGDNTDRDTEVSLGKDI
ncbi:MAG TPA: hypothetical protein DHU65_02055 [Clostridiales bacterium]|nr:hypothetical protein [Clostridiales bacterium]